VIDRTRLTISASRMCDGRGQVHDDDPGVGALERTDGGAATPPHPAAEILAAIAARSAAKMGRENFPVALRVLPRGPREALARVYRFARFVDDVGDEAPGGPAQRLALLDVVAAEIEAEWSGARSSLRPVRDLGPLISSVRMPSTPFLDLVEANRRDLVVGEYPSFDALIEYCRYSANPVGRVVLRLAGADDERNLIASDAVCSALQVLEHCQDVGEDARAGRVYLPQDDLSREGVSALDLQQPPTSVGLRRAVAVQVARADQMLADGPGLVSGLHGWARFAVAGYLAGGQATARALRSADYDVLARTIRPSKPRTAALLVRHLVRR
jgi:squalene synthase HpnC